jgi:hypothetical protein
VDAHQRRGAGLEVQVRPLRLDEPVKSSIDLEHGVSIGARPPQLE